jgi:hypothetical protein
MFLDARCKFFILVSLLYVSSASSPVAVAQDPIRVQTREVLVPVTVYNKDRLELPTNFRKAYLRGEMQTVDKIVEGFVIRNLTASDFQVFEDGVKQTVQGVSYEPSLYWNVRDNRETIRNTSVLEEENGAPPSGHRIWSETLSRHII